MNTNCRITLNLREWLRVGLHTNDCLPFPSTVLEFQHRNENKSGGMRGVEKSLSIEEEMDQK
jgi:hypothetical protein